MTKKKPAPNRERSSKKSPAALPPITQEAVERLEKLAEDLEEASKEAAAVADLARHELAEELSAHLVDPAAEKKRSKPK